MSAPIPHIERHEGNENRPKHDVAEIFSKYMPIYLKNHKLDLLQFKVVKAIMACRTALLGGHVRECDHDPCCHTDQSYNSCGNRHCPKCQGVAKNKWLKKRLEELLPIHYFHVVFTVPHLLNDLALYNKKIFYDILFKASAETLQALSLNPDYLGGKTGFFGILHTWGQAMALHPHIHFIFPGGGIRTDKAGNEYWVELPKKGKFLFPKKVMANLFRGKFIDDLKKAYDAGKLKLPDNLDELKDTRFFELFIDQAVNRRWNVFAKKPFASPAEVLLYIGRYTHRVAISNYRILSVDDGKVSFEYKDYKDEGKPKITTISAIEFIRRFLLHILPSGYHKIRMYGFMANSGRAKNVEKAKRLILEHRSVFDFEEALVDKLVKSLSDYSPDRCPKCGKGTMIKKEGIAPTGSFYIEVADTS